MLKKLKDECYIVMGQSPSSEFYNQNKDGIPFLQGRKTFGDKHPIIDTWTTKPLKIGNKNSVLMSVRAPVGDVNIAPFDICIGRGLASIKMKNNNNQYLYYLLKNNVEKIKNKSSGTVFDAINRNDLENLVLNFNDEREQIKIEKILYSIDKKIELNNKINNNLYELSDNLYNEWFVKFNFPKFDGKLKESELGMIPEKWNVGYFDDCILTQIIKSGVQNFDDFKKYIATADVTNTDITNYTLVDYHNKPSRANMTPISSSVWFAKMENSIKNILVDDYMDDILNNYIFSTGFMGIECFKSSVNYIWSIINNCKFIDIKNSLSTGTLMAGISNTTIVKFKYLIPDEETLEQYDLKLREINRKIYNNKKQNETLSQLRDTLLPKLMNGEIDLDSIEI